MLAVAAARQRGRIDAAEEARLVAALAAAPGLVAQALALEPQIAEAARDLSRARDVLFLGRGALYPLALEGALKLKEISYIHAEGYASGELKHGPIALIDEDVPVIVLAPSDALFDKTVSNMQEVMARDGKVLLVSDADGLAHAGHGTWAPPADAGDRPLRRADRLRRPGPAPRLPHRRPQGHRRRPAPQPGEVGDGGVGGRPASLLLPAFWSRTVAASRSISHSTRLRGGRSRTASGSTTLAASAPRVQPVSSAPST